MSIVVSYKLADMYKKYEKQTEKRYIIDVCRSERFSQGSYDEYHSYYCSKRLMPSNNMLPPSTEDEIQGFIRYSFKTPDGAKRSFNKVKEIYYKDTKNSHYEVRTLSYEVITLKEMLQRWRSYNRDVDVIEGIYYETHPVGFKYKEYK